MPTDITHVYVPLLMVLAMALAAYKFGREAQKLVAATEDLKKETMDMKTKLAALERIPLVEQRLGQVEALVSRLPHTMARVQSLEDWRGSLRNFKAVRSGSRPDINGEDEEE
jgi:hypothetical protein